MTDDDRRDLRHGRPPLPGRLPSRGRVREHAPGDHRRRARLPHPRPRAARRRLARRLRRGGSGGRLAVDLRRGRGRPRSTLPKLERGEAVDTREVAAEEKETKPPRRYSDASLLAAMETAGKLVDDDELREAMKDSGIGTPATRAAIIERLIDVGYVERDGPLARVHREGPQRDPPARRAPADLAVADRRLGDAAGQDRARRGAARGVHARHRAVRRRDRHRARRQAQGRPHPARQPRAVPGLRPRHRREPQGLLLLVARGPGLRVRDLEVQGRQDAAGRGRARADLHRAHRAPP